MKFEVIKKCKIASAYKQIDLLDKPNILSKSKITIAEMKPKDMVAKSQIDTFKQEYLLASIRKLFGKTKLGSLLCVMQAV